ncbi:MAG: hypothetical protein KGI60_03510 [Patescibacteria group bacterium]|nr:hypothetical protein [Patescibacteria group bacterium]
MRNRRRAQKMRSALFQSVDLIMQDWKLCAEEKLVLLGLRSQNEFNALCSGTLLPKNEVLLRASSVVQIHRALHTLLPSRSAADGWVKRPNKAEICKGRTALAVMLAEGLSGMQKVHSYLMSYAS